MPPGLQVTSGIGTVSGIAAVNALPVTLYGASGDVISDYSGALNINISGGSISANVSGNVVVIASGGGAISGANVIVATSGVSMVVIGVSGGFPLQAGDTGANLNLRVSLYNGARLLTLNTPGDSVSYVSDQALENISLNTVFDGGSNSSRMRSVDAISGGKQSGIGILASQIVGYDYSGAQYFPLATSASGSKVLSVAISGGAGSPNISGGVTVSGGINVSGTVAVLSGLVGILSGVISIQSGNLSVSSGQVIVTSGGTLPIYVTSGNFTSGVVDIGQYPTYGLVSYWSGAVGKGLIGIYNSGGVSGMAIQVTRLDVSIWASGQVNRIDVILGSGNVSGTAGTINKYLTVDATSVGVGYVDGATQVSGHVISTLDSFLLESNARGIMNNYSYEYNVIRKRPPTVLSGQELWVQMASGIGIGVISLDWIERLLS